MAKKRLVRNQLVFSKIRSYPFDLFLAINEFGLAIDWDDYIPHTLPIGIATNLAFTILRKLSQHYADIDLKRDNSIFRTDYATFQAVVSRARSGVAVTPVATSYNQTSIIRHVLWAIRILSSSIVLVSVVNCIIVLGSQYRTYTLLNLSADSPRPKGSNVIMQNVSVAAPKTVFSRLLSYFEEHSYYESESEADDTQYETKPTEKDVWALKVWDPLRFQVHLLATFSPVSLFVIWLTSRDVALWKILLGVAVSSSAFYIIVSKFFSLLADKQIVFQEMFTEYNKKYVIPQTVILRKNAVVDATKGPRAAAQYIVHDDKVAHLQNDNTFLTHDIHGKRIKSTRANMDRERESPMRYPEILSLRRSSRRPSYIDDTESAAGQWIPQSTPFLSRSRPEIRDYPARDTFGRDPFVRPVSRPTSPTKLPTRLGFAQSPRTQLTPGRVYLGFLSPARSPSPQKRGWR